MMSSRIDFLKVTFMKFICEYGDLVTEISWKTNNMNVSVLNLSLSKLTIIVGKYVVYDIFKIYSIYPNTNCIITIWFPK